MPHGLLFIAATVYECGWIAQGLGLRRVNLHRWEGTRAALEAVGIGARRTPAVPVRGVRVIVAGFAGALDPSLQRAQVLRWADGEHDQPGPVVTTQAIISTPAQKHALRASSGARAVDMEHGTISAWARAGGACVEGCRVVLDLADETLPAWLGTITDDLGRLRWGAFAAGVVPRPARWFELARWARTSSFVGRTLARAASFAATSPLPPATESHASAEPPPRASAQGTAPPSPGSPLSVPFSPPS
ncbi:MAG: hypothetical protein KF859_07920 [Phycisphaeraceae bacterium]|nr:hypothetical protein [Phycisphaeraceae bacterium]